MAARLTRAEGRERTRRRLLDAGADLFATKGFGGASVEEIAERAGFTRGAFYSNFAGKADLFLALMDQRNDQRVAQIRAVMSGATSPTDVLAGLKAWAERRDDDDRSWVLLSTEFRLYALRHPEVRPLLAERNRAVRRLYAQAITSQFEAVSVEPPAPIEDLAALLNVLDHGVPLEQAMDPEDIRQGFFFDMLTLLFEAAVALAEARSGDT